MPKKADHEPNTVCRSRLHIAAPFLHDGVRAATMAAAKIQDAGLRRHLASCRGIGAKNGRQTAQPSRLLKEAG